MHTLLSGALAIVQYLSAVPTHVLIEVEDMCGIELQPFVFEVVVASGAPNQSLTVGVQ